MNKKILLLIFVGLFLISFVYAEDIGLFKQGDNVRVFQTCNNCTFCNVTSSNYLRTNTTIIGDVEMTENPKTYFFFDIPGENITILGEYNYCYNCGNDVETRTGCNEFKVNLTGKESSTGESILYFIFIMILFFILVIMIYFIIVLPSENEKAGDGTVVGILRLKYVRIFLIAVSYPILIILLNLMNGLAVNFSNISIFSGTIGFLFEVLLRAAWPFTIIIIIWIVVLLIKDSNTKEAMKKFGRFRI